VANLAITTYFLKIIVSEMKSKTIKQGFYSQQNLYILNTLEIVKFHILKNIFTKIYVNTATKKQS